MVDRQAHAQTRVDRLRRHDLGGSSAERTILTRFFDELALSDLDRMIIRDLVGHAGDPDDGPLMGIVGLMLAALGEGSLCLDLDTPLLPERPLPGVGSTVSALLSMFSEGLQAGCYDALIDRSGGAAFKPMVLDDTTGRRLLYFQKFHYHEQRLKDRLASFFSLPAKRLPTDTSIRTVIEGLYQEKAVIRAGPDNDPIVRDPYQVEAIRAALTVPLLIISGGPGTGKTSLLVNILRALVRTGSEPSRMALAAPTGRAAQRITEALQANLATIAVPDDGDRRLGVLSASTLHKLLVYRKRNDGFLYGEGRSLPVDLIAVDEVSMVDVVMMDRLFQAIDPGRTHVILMGDKDQLPSVEAGSVLADMSSVADSGVADHVVVLRHVYRSGGQLLELGRSINAGQAVSLTPMDFDQALALEAGRWAFVQAQDGATLNRHLERWVTHQYGQRTTGHACSYVALMQRLNRLAELTPSSPDGERRVLLDRLFAFAFKCRILTVLRRGPGGAGWINHRIAAGLRQRLDPDSDPDQLLFNGALIMITRNDYQRDLTNGDVGLVVRQPDGLYQVFFKRSGTITAFPASGLPDWELAFAMTVHKSQGSEFKDTLLLLPHDPKHRLLTREILYTAVTRASRRLIVYGTPSAFQTALNRKIERRSGLTQLGKTIR